MVLMKKVALGIYPTRANVEHGIVALRKAGFPSAEISVLYPDNLDSPEVAQAKSDHTQVGAAIGGGSGIVVGGTLGWLAGMVALTIPGTGPFLVAGPLLGALAGAGVGGVVGEITGSLVGMGVSKAEAKQYEGRVKKGEILVSVHSEVQESLEQAREILRQTGAQDVVIAQEGRLAEMGDIRASRDAA